MHVHRLTFVDARLNRQLSCRVRRVSSGNEFSRGGEWEDNVSPPLVNPAIGITGRGTETKSSFVMIVPRCKLKKISTTLLAGLLTDTRRKRFDPSQRSPLNRSSFSLRCKRMLYIIRSSFMLSVYVGSRGHFKISPIIGITQSFAYRLLTAHRASPSHANLHSVFPD